MNSRSTLPELVRDSKLEASFHPTADLPTTTIHTNFSGRRTIRQDIWVRERKLGHGGYGIVWLERKKSSPQEAPELRAVKELNVRGNKKGHYVRELEALAKFSQDKFVQYFVKSHGWFESNDNLFIALEYCEHGDMKKYLGNYGRLPEEQTQDISWQVLQGLCFMHANHFAHRDLKPANILIRSKPPEAEWHVKICDLGLSKRIEGDKASTSVRGTPGFTPPELCSGISRNPRNADPLAADIWCLGETIFHMLTLKTTFNSELQLLDYWNDSSEFPRTELETAGASEHCTDFINMLMLPRPEQRPNAQEVLLHPWMLAASEPPTSLPDVTALSSNFNSALSISNQIQADETHSGSWSTMTQHVAQSFEKSTQLLTPAVLNPASFSNENKQRSKRSFQHFRYESENFLAKESTKGGSMQRPEQKTNKKDSGRKINSWESFQEKRIPRPAYVVDYDENTGLVVKGTLRSAKLTTKEKKPRRSEKKVRFEIPKRLERERSERPLRKSEVEIKYPLPQRRRPAVAQERNVETITERDVRRNRSPSNIPLTLQKPSKHQPPPYIERIVNAHQLLAHFGPVTDPYPRPAHPAPPATPQPIQTMAQPVQPIPTRPRLYFSNTHHASPWSSYGPSFSPSAWANYNSKAHDVVYGPAPVQ